MKPADIAAEDAKPTTAVERLERRRAERAKAEEEAAAKRAEAAAEDELRALDELERLQAKHGADNVALVPTAAGPFIVKGPTDAQYKRFRNGFWKDSQKAEVTEALALACTLYPSSGEAAAAFKAKPLIVEPLANRAVELGGAASDPK